jgi:lysophospholipase L1-like esterase
MPANPALPTIWVVGDSTANNSASGGLGWGAPFIKLFDPDKVNVVNRARGGRSSRSFQVEGLWDWVLEDSKPGDYVILQMGHNDGGGTNVSNPNGRPSLPGLGDETAEVTLPAGRSGSPPERTEIVHTYGWYMKKYVTDARARGLKIIIASSVPHAPREMVNDGDVETRFRQVAWAEEVAAAERVPFIHVNKIILSKYAGMEPAEIREKYFTPPGDGTHTNPAGAELNAKCVAEGLKTLGDLPFKDWLLP